jgi:hypothetical protein
MFEMKPESINLPAGAAFTYYLLNENLTPACQCTFTATPGNVLVIEVSACGPRSAGRFITRGVNVTGGAPDDVKFEQCPPGPSPANLTC